MPRLPRNEIEPGIHHVYARGVERRVIFVDDDDRRRYLRMLARTVQAFRWRLLAYCLMPNHVHLLIETREPNLGRGMHALHGPYAQQFNERHVRVGHLFQSRYGSRRVYEPEGIAAVLAYIAANPVAAGLCAEPADWLWSSHRVFGRAHAFVDTARAREHLAELGDPVAVYDTFVQARLISCVPRELG